MFERKDYVLDDSGVLAIKGLGQFKEFRVSGWLGSMRITTRDVQTVTTYYITNYITKL